MSRFLFLCLLLSGIAVAQDPAPPPGLPGLPAANNPAAAAANAPDGNQPVQKPMIFPKINGDQLADLYREFTGRRVTVSVAAADAEFRFVQPPPLTYGEAAQLIKKAALLEGFVFVPDANMAGHDVLVIATGGANPKGEGLEVIIDPADLPQDDRVVSYVMNLKYIKPEEIVRTFTTVIGQFGAYGSITPIPNAGAVVITEKTSLIRRLIELVDEIDVSASVATRFIKVQYADVQELSDTLNEIFNSQQQAQSTARTQRVQNNPNTPVIPGLPNPAANAAAAAAAAGGASSAAEDVPIQIVPDTRTNRIFAMGRPVDIVFIEGLVREFDSKTDERNFLRRKLRFVAVADFLEIAEPALQRTFGSSDSTSAGGGGSGGRSTGANFGNNTSSSNRNSTSSNSSRNNFSGSSFGGSSGGSFGGSGGGSSLGDPNINSAPEARLVGRTLLVADNITNSLVVQGPPSAVEVVNNLLDEIDVKAEQVMISAVFGQLALGEDFDFGMDFLRTIDENQAARGNGVLPGQLRTSPGAGSLVDPLTLLNPAAFPSSAGLSLYGMIGDHWNVYLNALQSDSRFEVMSRPTIYTANNRKGLISAGQRIAVPTNSNQFNNSFTTNIEYQDVLLSLEVIPLVNSDDEVTLEIALINDEVIGEQLIENVGLVPTIGRREVLTTVTVPDGATIVLGGLITSTKRESVTGVPLLSDIPGLGKLFSRTSTEDDRQELMIFIQPRIVDGAASLYDAQADMDSRYDVSGSTREFSNGPGVLPERDSSSGSASSSRSVPVAQPVEDDEESSARRLLGRPGSRWRH
ncbi:secretin N-terminal domain-containing protein [Haloferula sp. A504]|uniref:secretin N-terminal domain-containing protein n=1 Tax=Haloferula sp. A504 TaxID=3373601 RepID=UPI0031C1DACC|nr:hypothetical protein [Verrucomicrobiaceae bacterium E54]